jgi:hypothetical protein
VAHRRRACSACAPGRAAALIRGFSVGPWAASLHQQQQQSVLASSSRIWVAVDVDLVDQLAKTQSGSGSGAWVDGEQGMYRTAK